MKPEVIFAWVKDNYGYSKGILIGKTRGADIVFARHVAMFLVVEKCGLSFPQAGRVFKKDHSTVIHAHNKVRSLLLDGKLNLDIDVGFQPSIKHNIEFDQIMTDSMELIKHKFNIALSKDPLETMMALCKLAKELDERLE